MRTKPCSSSTNPPAWSSTPPTGTTPAPSSTPSPGTSAATPSSTPPTPAPGSSAQFFHKTSSRRYIAVCWGNLESETGTITGNIGRSLANRKVMACFPDGSHGKPAVTHWRVLERLGYVNVVECILETGRTHQIRAHFKHIRHPLFNDKDYGGDEILKGTTFAKYRQFVQNCFDTCPRQALHAKTLGFDHPLTGERLSFDSPLPDDMRRLIEKWRAYVQGRDA